MGDAAIYIKLDKREELKNAIRTILEDREIREELIERGKRQASRFRPEVVAYNLINCYRRLDVDVRG